MNRRTLLSPAPRLARRGRAARTRRKMDDPAAALARIPLFRGVDPAAIDVARLGGLNNRSYRVERPAPPPIPSPAATPASTSTA